METQTINQFSKQKVIPLEALRWIACFIEILYHFTLSFMPALIYQPGVHQYAFEGWLIGTPLYAFTNGFGMVMVFFILSGYVLSLKGLAPQPERKLLETALKRYARFFPLILFSLLISYLLFRFNLLYYNESGMLSGSFWLQNEFFYNTSPPTIRDVFSGAFSGVILFGDERFNTVLWTMNVEFVGSLIVLFLAFFLSPQRKKWLLLLIPLTIIFIFLSEDYFYSPRYYLGFLIGFSGVLFRFDTYQFRKIPTTLLLVLSIYFIGFQHNTGCYAWLYTASNSNFLFNWQIGMNNAGGFLLLIVFSSENYISRFFRKDIFSFFGNLSFPVYLTHTLIITSLSSWVYIKVGGGSTGILMAALAFFPACLLIAVPISYVEQKWLSYLSSFHPIDIIRKISFLEKR